MCDLAQGLSNPEWPSCGTGNVTADVNVCAWRGVVCDNGVVTKILALSENTKGVSSLPSSIGLLSSLNFLHIGPYRGLEGTLVTSIGSLSALTYLSLFETKLNGPLPSSLALLSKGKEIQIYDNSFTGTVPEALFALQHIRILDLSGNALQGTIPSTVDAPKLYILDLGENNLVGTVPSSLATLSSLEYLVINQNSLTGSLPPELCTISGLLELSAGDNPGLTCYADCLSSLMEFDAQTKQGVCFDGKLSVHVGSRLVSRLSGLPRYW